MYIYGLLVERPREPTPPPKVIYKTSKCQTLLVDHYLKVNNDFRMFKSVERERSPTPQPRIIYKTGKLNKSYSKSIF